jgi:superfamily I DNA/RNA helicase
LSASTATNSWYEHGDDLAAQWPSDLEVFLRQTAEYFVEQSERLNRLGYEMELINLDANVETIKVLAEGADYVVEMIRKIEELFDQPDKQSARAADWFAGAIQYMTGHKCKGLEFDTVFLLRLDLCPHPKAKSEKFKAQDKNLLYVMKSRAMKELYFVRKERDER